MNKSKATLVFSSLFLLTTLINAQSDSLSKSIPDQYKAFKSNAKTWEKYFLITEPEVNALYTSIYDSVKTQKAHVAKQDAEIKGLQKQINSQSIEVNALKKELEEVKKSGSSVSVLGASFNKNTYSTMMWLIVVGLLALAGFTYSMYFRANKITSNAKRDYDKLNEEFEHHKKRALEKEMKLRRELQTEINKNDELSRK